MKLEPVYIKTVHRIKARAKELGYKLYELADLLEISHSNFSNKINLINSRFTLAQLVAIADEFYMTLDELILGKNEGDLKKW